MDPFVAEIRIFGFNFAPRGWAFCQGQRLPISQNTALFSLLGTTYGGDGRANFALPNLQGNVAIGPGNGPGLSVRSLGETGGEAQVTLLQAQLPTHSHSYSVSLADATGRIPNNERPASASGVGLYSTVAPTQSLSSAALLPEGGSQPHNSMMPSLVMNFCIALQGVFPPRS